MSLLQSVNYHSPVGVLQLIASESNLLVLSHPGQPVPKRITELIEETENALLQETCKELDAYFAGQLKTFSIPVAPRGTDFQKAVWQQLLEIPYNETRSYQWVAERVGNPKAVRAVGASNGRNPISIIIPCHRVIGKSSALTGYAGGLKTKSYLLGFENGEPELEL